MVFAIRHFFIIFSVIYTFFKIVNITVKRTHTYGMLLPISIILSLMMELISSAPAVMKLFITFFVLLVFITLYSHTKWDVSVMVMVISFAISFISLFLGSMIVSIFLVPIFPALITPDFFAIVMNGIFQFLIIYSLFKIKRLKNGMPFLYKSNYRTAGCYISLAIIIIFLFLQQLSQTMLALLTTIVTTTLLSLALLYWWRRKITQSYIEKLRLGELEDLYNKLEAKQKEIEMLKSHNESLGRIIHKDNKLIPAMEMAICNYLQNAADMNSKEAQQYGTDLLAQLQKMSAERKGVLHSYQENFATHPQIGIPSIDAVLLYMEKRATEAGIRYQMKFDKELKESLLNYMEESDALHLLSDLIENAIIAVSESKRKSILIHIGLSYDKPFFDIYDSGIAFTVETYQNFGNIRYTTHEDTGGSGIGLTDICKLKRKYKASLQIYELPPQTSAFTKKIRIWFDRKNHFLIQSYRAKEIKTELIRNDIHVFPYNTGPSSDIGKLSNTSASVTS